MAQGRRIDVETRRKIVDAYNARRAAHEDVTYKSIGAEFGVGAASVSRFLGAARRGESLEPRKAQPRPTRRKCTAEQGDQIAAWAVAHPSARGHELIAFAATELKVEVSEGTIRRILRARNVGKRRLVRVAATASEQPSPDQERRYKARHRRTPESREGRRSYPSDFTNAEWSVVETVWREHARSFPVEHELREVLEALRYIGATGTPWRYLPHDFPPHQTVRRWFDTWTRDGTIQRVNDTLRRSL